MSDARNVYFEIYEFPFMPPSGRFLQYITLITDENLYYSYLLGREKGFETAILIYPLKNSMYLKKMHT